ncbi:TPA: hypothetical protein EYO12_03205 [Candidatus Saccharibacteria bacterium]|nr:hypothetical protein [Candidatus Saccharibacteria bacterium]HIO87959.1 hypothetical protein [Candidatus Saccharibacteria bacterium]
MFTVTRNKKNPIIKSNNDEPWRALAAFNCSPAKVGDSLHLVFRAMTDEALYKGHNVELSTIGHVMVDPQTHHSIGEYKVLIQPEEDWEMYGCEDPRVTKIDDTYYIFYTALSGFPYSAENIKCAVATTKDFKTIDSRQLVTPFNAKAMALFPEKVDGKWTVILTADSDKPPSKMAIAQSDNFDDFLNHDWWANWYEEVEHHNIDLRRVDTDHCEVGAPPIKTDAGWLLIYSHIQDYFTDDKVFGIEAVLLDKDNPRKIIGRTRYPFMVPEESYEQYGQLPDIVFPSGAMLDGDILTVFYGAADTTCASAKLRLSHLLESMQMEGKSYAKRYSGNPILLAKEENYWESSYVLNPSAIEIDGEINILYRALGPDNTSVCGLAITKDGYTIDERLDEPIYIPRAKFESKLKPPDGISGCEDLRAQIIGDRIFVTYTGYNGVDPPAVAASSISIEEFKNRKFQSWTEPHLISPVGIDDKDAAIFSEKINDQYLVFHRIDHHICADTLPELDFEKHQLDRCIQVMGPRKGMWDSLKIGINGPPIKTEKGWLQFYHGINEHHHYLMGAALLDLKDPTKIIGRSAMPIMEPETQWELEGWIDNVIFSCGQVVRDDTIFIYYGGADTVVAVATLSLSELLSQLNEA